MNRDRLFLLKPGFKDAGEGPYYCPGCAEMLGLLQFYPALQDHLDLRFVDFQRPRQEIVALLGEENQSCPVLVLQNPPRELHADLKVQRANGHAFVEGAREIGEYLASIHGTGIPH